MSSPQAQLIVKLTPNVMDVVETSNLGEESGKGFIVAGPVRDGAGPVVGPLDHRARLQSVRAHLVDVAAVCAGLGLGPVAEREQVLQVSGA